MQGFDHEILNDFLTESGELLEELDADLVSLEDASDDPELLNKVFRALHTIKGSASFLALTNLVEIAHVAEDALNVARRGEVEITETFMDLLLSAIDVLKGQFEELQSGAELSAAPAELVGGLAEIGRGGAGEAEPDGGAEAPEAAGGDRALTLPENKDVLLEFMVDDLEATIESLMAVVTDLHASGFDEEHGALLADAAEGLARTAEFFEVDSMVQLVRAIAVFAEESPRLDEAVFFTALQRVEAVMWLLKEISVGLRERVVRAWPIETLLARLVATVSQDEAVAAEAELPPDLDTAGVLEADGVLGSAAPAEPDRAAEEPGKTAPTPPEPGVVDVPAETEAVPQAVSVGPAVEPEPTPAGDAAKSGGSEKANGRPMIEQTIRVEVSRLESLLNLVGELVLQKNRISALTRQVGVLDGVGAEMIESLSQSSSDLDRVTGDIQGAVMRTRLQPLDKIFGKYPRLIRDLAKKTGKNIRLVVEGGDTEVDKSVIEELGDPLVHLLRNSADHGIETVEERAQTDKPAMGTITLSAAHEGSHVTVKIQDDGKGICRERIGSKAVERGLVTREELDALPDREVFRFILAAGLSTAEQVSDLSGRGVGMDVVRSNIEKVKGTIDVDSVLGQGTTITIRIPLTVAIMPAMMVGVAKEMYAVPLSSIIEIVRPEDEQMNTVNGRQVMRLRDSVLPLVRVSELFDVPETDPALERFAVVIELNGQQAGLVVTELIGQQEIVVKPLDAQVSGEGAVSGATVRDDGGVSLIVDVERMVHAVQNAQNNTPEPV